MWTLNKTCLKDVVENVLVAAAVMGDLGVIIPVQHSETSLRYYERPIS